MTREQLIENFADSVEQERIALGYSQAQMAQHLICPSQLTNES